MIEHHTQAGRSLSTQNLENWVAVERENVLSVLPAEAHSELISREGQIMRRRSSRSVRALLQLLAAALICEQGAPSYGLHMLASTCMRRVEHLPGFRFAQILCSLPDSANPSLTACLTLLQRRDMREGTFGAARCRGSRRKSKPTASPSNSRLRPLGREHILAGLLTHMNMQHTTPQGSIDHGALCCAEGWIFF